MGRGVAQEGGRADACPRRDVQSYVFLHRIAQLQDPPYPLNLYIESLVSLFARGAIVPPRRKETS